MLISIKKIIKKVLNLKLVKMLGYVLNWSEEGFVIKNLKNTVPWACVFSDLNSEEIVGTCYEKELQKANKERV